MHLKRIFDFFVSAVALLVLLPMLIVLAVSVRVSLGSPVFFSQIRPGLGGRPFRMIKYRTMTAQLDTAGTLLADEKRLTGFGKFLRSTSLDELPELINVLKGEMSLVGPRPLLMEYLDRYTLEQNRRHEVRPGITGWAQINGRNAIGWDEKFLLDVWYVDHRSFWLDIKILVITLMKVFKREDISQKGHVTVEKFIGRNTGEE